MSYAAYTKDPDAVTPLTLDWSGDLSGDTIATSTWPEQAPGITVVSTASTGTTATIKVAGGSHGHSYRFVNRITSAGGRTEDWVLYVHVLEPSLMNLTGPPFATIAEHALYTPAADGEEALKVEMVAADAADLVQRLAPIPPAVSTVITTAMDDSQTTLTITDTYPDPLPTTGELLIGSEVMRYTEKDTLTSTLKGVIRGIYATTPAAHSASDAVTEVGYPIRARRAELAIFEWLFSSRGWRPSRSGVLGAETYLTGSEVYDLVRQIMGPYYGRKGGAVTKRVTMAPRHKYDKRSRMDPRSWQMGWYDI